MAKAFTIKARDAARESLYVRLAPTMIDRLNALQKDTGVNRADIIQQALEYALEHLEVEGRVSE